MSSRNESESQSTCIRDFCKLYWLSLSYGSGSRIVAVSKNVTSLFGFLFTTLYFLKEYPEKKYTLYRKYRLHIKANIYCVLTMCQTCIINSFNPATTP